ncbi:MAG: hypothetical protein RSA20_03900, partial [Oscillospiraceae bacterium]
WHSLGETQNPRKNKRGKEKGKNFSLPLIIVGARPRVGLISGAHPRGRCPPLLPTKQRTKKAATHSRVGCFFGFTKLPQGTD